MRLFDYLGTPTARCRGCGGDYTEVLDLDKGGEHLCIGCTKDRCANYLMDDLDDITVTVDGPIAHLSDGRNVLFQDGEPLTSYTDTEAAEWTASYGVQPTQEATK